MAIHLFGKYQYVLNILIHGSFSLTLLIFLYIACLRIFFFNILQQIVTFTTSQLHTSSSFVIR